MALLRNALVAIANSDATPTIGLQALMGRTADLLVPWRDVDVDGPFPVLTYQLKGFTQTGQDNDTRDGTVTITAFADGNNALAVASSLVGRCEDLFTAPAFLAHGLDAAPMLLTRDDDDNTGDGLDAGDPRDGSRNLRRADLDFELTLCRAA
jgi:hypothetical protein